MPIKNFGNFSTQSTRINKDNEKHISNLPVDTGRSGDETDQLSSSKKQSRTLDLTSNTHGNFFPGIDTKNNAEEEKDNSLEKTSKSASDILTEHGLDNNQPEILSVSEFLPLYDKQGMRNDVGDLLDQQLSIRNLLLNDVEETITSIRKNAELSSDFDKLVDNYKKVVKDTETRLRVKSTILGNLNSMKNALDLKENEDKIQREVDRIRVSSGVKKTRNGSASTTSTTFPLGMYTTPRQIMICHLKFTNEGYENFSNSKIIGQIISDLKMTIEEHSPQLLETFSEERKNDRDAIRILNEPVRNDNFTFKREDISSVNSLQSTTSSGLQTKNMNKFGNFNPNSISSFTKFIESLPRDDINRAKFLISLLSKEMRISAGLTRLSNTDYDDLYQIEDSNFISRIIGEIGDSIIGEDTQIKSLSRIVRIKSDNNIILPLERRSVVDDNTGKTFIPGSIYFVDSIVNTSPKPNLQELESYAQEIKDSTDNSTTALYTFLNFNDENETLFFGDTFRRIISPVNDLIKTIESNSKSALLSLALISLSQSDIAFKNMLFKYVKELSTGVLITRKQETNNSEDTKAKPNEFENLSGTPKGKDAKDITNNNGESDATLVDKKITGTDPTIPDNTFFADDGKQANLKSTSISYEIEKKLMSMLVSSNKTLTKTHIKFANGEIEKFLNDGIKDKNSVFNRISEITDQLTELANQLSTKGPNTRRNYKSFKDSNNLTKYSGYSDDTLLLIVFEIIACIAKEFTSPRFSGKMNDNVIINYNPDLDKTISSSIDKLVTSQESTKNLSGYTSITTLLDSMYFAAAQEDNVIRDLIDVIRAFTNIIDAASDSTVSFFNAKQTSSGDSKIMIDLFNDTQHDDIFKNLSNTQLAASWRAHEMIMKVTDNSLLPKNQVISLDEKNVIESMLRTEKFNFACAKNARLAAIGLPAGMLDNLQNPSFIAGVDKNLESSNEDIISIQVFRRDPQFSDIIFKPITYLFDMSRFVSNEFNANENIDFETFLDSKIKLVNILGAKGPTGANSFSELSSKKEYSSLTNLQKADLFRNHVQDELLKIYLQLMTGVDMSESNFISNENLVRNKPIDSAIKAFFEKSNKSKEISPLKLMCSSDDTKDITSGISLNNSLSYVVTSTNITETSKDKEDSASSSINREDEMKKSNMISDGIGSQMKKMGAIKQGNQQNKKLEGMRAQLKTFLNNSLIRITEQMIRTEQPKLFERIFMIVIDPDNFIIDDKQTNSTKFGRMALQSAISNNCVVEEKINKVFVKKIKTRNVSQGDFTFSEFFVTVSLGAVK